MKIHRNKIILIVFALQLLMLLSVIALVYGTSARGRTVTLKLTGYDPYDALRGRYLQMRLPDSRIPLDSGSVRRYENMAKRSIPVYVVLDREPGTGLSYFSYASLDRPASSLPYIRCTSNYLRTYEDTSWVDIQPRINQYYLNEKHADALDRSLRRDSEIRLNLKIWRGMYVIDGIEVEGQAYE